MKDSTDKVEGLVDHLFRKEYSRLLAYLLRFLGPNQMPEAEDIVQETLTAAFNSWRDHSVPKHPEAWLFRVAKNKALTRLAKQTGKALPLASTYHDQPIDPLLDDEIEDSLLRMIFACCSPTISYENQILLVLNALCGLNRKEVADALLLPEETVKKRLYRVKAFIRKEKVRLEVPTAPLIGPRLNAVCNTLYLMFNQGYYSRTDERIIRREVCLEAMRLNKLLITQFPNNTSIRALFALMCFHTARFDARIDENGVMILLADQNRKRWNKELIKSGIYHLSEASKGDAISSYHIEANIAALHTTAKSLETTDWQLLLKYYSWLHLYKPSPIIDLNMIIVESKICSSLPAIEKLKWLMNEKPFLASYYLSFCTKGQLYLEMNRPDLAVKAFTKAKSLTNSKREQSFVQSRIDHIVIS